MLQDDCPHYALLGIYKSFTRPHLDYRDIIQDKTNNESFKSKIENVWSKSCIAIAGAIHGIS